MKKLAPIYSEVVAFFWKGFQIKTTTHSPFSQSNNIARRMVLLIFFIAVFGSAYPQGYYKLEYQFYTFDENGNKIFIEPKYEALLVDYGNKESVMRIRYYSEDHSTYLVVEQSITSYETTYTIADGSEVQGWVYKGENPRFISDIKSVYYPDIIVLKKNTNDNFYYPYFVYSNTVDANNNEIILYGDILKFENMNVTSLSNTYLSRFNWKWEDDTTPPSVDFTNATLHLFLVSGTKDMDLGPAFTRNHNKLKYLFRESAQTLGMKFNPIELIGENFTKEMLNSRVGSLKAGENDVIIFYYSGHGFRYSDQNDDTNRWPNLILTDGTAEINTDNTYDLSSIYTKLTNKHARLTLVIAECCNASIDQSTPRAPDYPMLAGSRGLKFKKSTLQELFSKRGSLLLSTSMPEEYSMYYFNLGGYFCNSFYESFLFRTGMTCSSGTGWSDIFQNAMDETIRIADSDSDKQTTQHPQIDFRIK